MKKLSLVFMLVLTSIATLVAQRTISGQVTDEDGLALIGATVLVKNTSIGTVTDAEGNYSVEVSEDATALVFSYTGYATREVEIGASNIINVTLEESAAQLQEVVVTGYGQQSRRLSTFNAATVDTKAFENIPVQSFEQALQGRLPGVSITGNSGTLGAQQAIRIRGTGSITASNQPLFVVDGQIINSDTESGFALGGPGDNPLLNINPNDIERVDVLKDAAATALYGARGSNGVIVITTRSGAYNQKPRVNVTYQAGWAAPTEQFDLLTGPQYAELWNQAAENAGFDPNNPDQAGFFYDDPASEPNADWLDQVYRDRAFSQETSASVSGGDQTTKYFFGATWRDDNGTVKTTNLQRYNFRANVEKQVNDKLTAGIKLNPSQTINNRQNEDNNVASPQTYSVLFFPNIDPFDENGEVRGGIVGTSNGFTQFAGTPLANLVGQDITTKRTQILAKPYIVFRPVDNLSLRTEFNTQFLQIEDLLKQGSMTTDGFAVDGAADGVNTQILNWTWKSVANYTNNFGNHSLDATSAFEMQRDEFSQIDVSGNTFADDRLKTLDAAAEITSGGGFRTEANFVRFINTVNYSFKNKYLLSASFVAEGSSRFGENSRYGFFPAVSAGWVLTEEPWLNIEAVNFLKVRGSWGEVGNAQFGNFDARGLIGFGNDYGPNPGFVFTQLANDNLEWERAQTVDFGIEFEMLNSRLNGSVTYFIKDSKDLLLEVPLPRTIGITDNTILQNAGEIRNQGLEFQVGYDIFDGPFRWTLGFNGATLDNEVRELVDNNNDGEGDDITGTTTLIREGETVRFGALCRCRSC